MGVEAMVCAVGRCMNSNLGDCGVCGLRGAVFSLGLMQTGVAVSGLIAGTGLWLKWCHLDSRKTTGAL